jgi:hypothetical protein
MAAKDSLNKDLFIEVFHASDSPTPPHLMEFTKESLARYVQEEGSNVHPEVIHAGSLDSAIDRHTHEGSTRPFVHGYRVPKSFVHPVVYLYEQEQLDYPHPDFHKTMVGTPEGLWEDIPAQPEDALKWNQAVPYRNRAEDRGSISYILPKRSIRGATGAKKPVIQHSRTIDLNRINASDLSDL